MPTDLIPILQLVFWNNAEASDLGRGTKTGSGSRLSVAEAGHASDLIARAQRAAGDTVHRIPTPEAELQRGVFEAYGLDASEIELVLGSLLPRDPLAVAQSTFRLPGDDASARRAGED